jgi:hypothetical protein
MSHRRYNAPLITALLALAAWPAAAQDAPAAETAAKVAAAGETTVRVESPFPVGLFRVDSLSVDPSSRSLDANLTVTDKKLSLLGVSPADVVLPNGDYTLDVGSGDEFHRLVVLKADGRPRLVAVHGDPTVSRVAGVVTIVLGLAAFICSPNTSSLFTTGQADALGIAALVCGGLSVGGAVVWAISSPWVEVR